MELDELKKVRIEMRNQVSSRRLELNLESIEIQIEEKESKNGQES